MGHARCILVSFGGSKYAKIRVPLFRFNTKRNFFRNRLCFSNLLCKCGPVLFVHIYGKVVLGKSENLDLKATLSGGRLGMKNSW